MIALVLAALLLNGNFEQTDPKVPDKPAHWDLPDGLGVQWTQSDDRAHGKAIRMDTRVSEQAYVAQCAKVGLTQWVFPKPAGNAIAETYGLSHYSDPVPVAKDQAYRVSFDFKGHSGGGKVWVRCYGESKGEKRRLYETIVFCEGNNKDGWTHFSQVFNPTKFRPAVTEMRVMLYAYYPAGVYWFDNVSLEPISAAEYEAEKKAHTR